MSGVLTFASQQLRGAWRRNAIAGTFVSFRVVGTFDPARLPRPSSLNEVPLETYRPSTLQGATASTRSLLGNQPLRSDLNPGGYLQSPPAILVPLKAMPLFW